MPQHLSYPRIPLYRLLDDTAAKTPAAPCTSFFGKRMTYKDIREASDHFAAGLQARGVRKGDRVALLLPNSPQFIIAYYGILKAGAVIVPLNPLYTERELTFHLTNSGAEMIVTIPMFLDDAVPLVGQTPLRHVVCSPLAEFLPFPLSLGQGFSENRMVRSVDLTNIVYFRSLLNQPLPANWQPEPVSPDDMAVLIYSGGTTGVAKGIMLSHYSLVANAHQLQAWVNMGPEERMLAVLPLFHGFGMSVTMNAPLFAGAEIVLMPRFVAPDVLKTIQKTKPTFLVGVPTMFVAFSNWPSVEKFDLHSVKGIFVGRRAVDQGHQGRVREPLRRAADRRLRPDRGSHGDHGQSLQGHAQARQHRPAVPRRRLQDRLVGWNSRFAPWRERRDRPAQPDRDARLLQEPSRDAETIKDGWLFTGDIGHMDEEGYFTITDRKKELIIVGGFNVFPARSTS